MELIYQRIADETKIPLKQIKAAAALLDDANTVPFIARYRKEMTGGLDENDLRLIEERLKFHRTLEQRREEVIRLIDEQGKLTEEILQKLSNASKLVEINDIYLPFRPKRKTRASIAREKGLAGLAEYLLSFPAEGSPEETAAAYLNDQVPDASAALQGAMDIIAEMVADDAEVRGWVRAHTWGRGLLNSEAKDAAAQSVYGMYYQYQEPLSKVPPHRVLAIDRGEREEFLKVAVSIDSDGINREMNRRFVKDGVTAQLVARAAEDGYARLIKPAIERDIRSEMTEKAQEHAMGIFARNLASLLMQPPVKEQVILGIDPAYRTGCKWAVVDDTGKMLEVGVVYPTPPHKKVTEAEATLTRIARKYGVTAIAIGNGTASRETEQFVADMIRNQNLEIPYTIVSEAGASVYSASKIAAQEFPALDVAERSAISIARRLQDPLAELVKIEPKAIGIGQYQHDLPPKELDLKLAGVVESAVNQVGVELNTASASLLSHVSGLSASVAQNIVAYRETNGRFMNRKQILKVAKLGPKAFQQAAGFLRIYGGDHPLDATAIHPESYDLAMKVLETVDARTEEIGKAALASKLNGISAARLADDLGAGLPTLKDVIECLQKPHRDPREGLPPPIFRTDVLSIDDLTPGMELSGTVRNVVDFGAFVDIGIKNDGLVHLSELANRFIRHPMEVVSVGDVVTVRVLRVDKERGKVALSMKPE